MGLSTNEILQKKKYLGLSQIELREIQNSEKSKHLLKDFKWKIQIIEIDEGFFKSI